MTTPTPILSILPAGDTPRKTANAINQLIDEVNRLAGSVSADRGDASATIQVLVDEQTQVWNTPLTADRTVTLSTVGIKGGDKFRVVRGPGATGAYNLNVGSGPLISLSVGDWWADFEVDSNFTWRLTGTGSTSTSGPPGSVTSVAMTGDGTVFNATVPGSPIISSGTLAPTLHTQTAHTVLAGPTSGSPAAPTFRALADADIPLTSAHILVGNGSNQAADVAASGAFTLANTGAATLSTNLAARTVVYVIDGGGNAITSGTKGYLQLFFAGTIQEVTLLADQSGSITVNIWKTTYSNFDAGSTHPVSGDSITASATPALSSATKYDDSTLTGWTTSISSGDILAFNIQSTATNITRVTITLKVLASS